MEWKLVPVEPIPEMVYVVSTILRDYRINRSAKQCEAAARLVIDAVLAAAPTPPDHIRDVTKKVTPPVQEDEPVAYQYRAPDIAQNWNKCSQREYELFFSKQIGYECRKLYTRPADDKLRKAAEEMLQVIDRWIDTDEIILNIPEAVKVRTLRAALEGK